MSTSMTSNISSSWHPVFVAVTEVEGSGTLSMHRNQSRILLARADERLSVLGFRATLPSETNFNRT